MVEVIVEVKLRDVRLLRAREAPLFWDEQSFRVLHRLLINGSSVLGRMVEGTLKTLEALLLFTRLSLIN